MIVEQRRPSQIGLHITHLYTTFYHMVHSVSGVFMGRWHVQSVGRLCIAFGKKGGKSSFFDLHRQFLLTDHAFRNDRNGFEVGIVVHNEPPPRLTGQLGSIKRIEA
jgi:hypothetical protein